jgi:hypothetical protein
MYELMNCEKYHPDFREKFMAFSGKLEISQQLLQIHAKKVA